MSEKKKISLNDRETISIGIMRKLPLKHIAKLIGKHVSSVTNEIKKHRVFVRGNYYAGNDCRYAQECNKKHVCGDMECFMYCYTCPKSCHSFCEDYFTNKCQKYEKPPYVCNACENRRYCKDDRYFYDSKVANKEAQEARSVSRRGIHLTDDELQDLDVIISTAIRKGQPMSHIFATYEDELPVTSRTVYTYIDMGILGVKNIDLRRQAGYRRRRKKRTESSVLTQQYRQGRSYEDFQKLIAEQGDSKVFEMDTVKGRRGYGKVMLTMMFRRNSIMLILLMDDCKAESVVSWFDFLEAGLGQETFHKLFEIGLTDNGSEFKKVEDLELSADKTLRTSMYYCDPMQSGQKGRLEKNHEYIRYVIPKSTSLNPYTQADMTVLMNHINSTKRPGLGDKSPYEMITDDDEGMHKLMNLLDLHPIPADQINLTKKLLNK